MDFDIEAQVQSKKNGIPVSPKFKLKSMLLIMSLIALLCLCILGASHQNSHTLNHSANKRHLLGEPKDNGFYFSMDVSIRELCEKTQYDTFIKGINNEYANVLNPVSDANDFHNVRTKKGWEGSIAKKQLWEDKKLDIIQKFGSSVVETSWTKQKFITQTSKPEIVKLLKEATETKYYYEGSNQFYGLPKKEIGEIRRPVTADIGSGKMFEYTYTFIGGKDGYPTDDLPGSHQVETVHYFSDFADGDFLYSTVAWMLTQEEWMVAEHPYLEGLREILLGLNNPKTCSYQHPDNFMGKWCNKDGCCCDPASAERGFCGVNKDFPKCTPKQIRDFGGTDPYKKLSDCFNWLGEGGSMVIKNLPQIFKLDLHKSGNNKYDMINKYRALIKPENKEWRKTITDLNGGNIGLKLWSHNIKLKDFGKDTNKILEIESINSMPDTVEDISSDKQFNNIFVMPAPSLIKKIKELRNEKRSEPGNEKKTGRELDELVGFIEYDKETMRALFLISLQTFTMIKKQNPEKRIVIHTGNWGSGAFGNNRLAAIYMQMLAAKTAQIDKVYFHDPLDKCISHEMFEHMMIYFGEQLFAAPVKGQNSLWTLSWDRFETRLQDFVKLFGVNQQHIKPQVVKLWHALMACSGVKSGVW